MEYLLTFLEGLASFISPCVLPLIPLYLSYFAGDEGVDASLPDGSSLQSGAAENGEAEGSFSQAKDTTEPEKSVVADEKHARNRKSAKVKHRVIARALFFVLGFTLMFVVFGGLVGFIGGFIAKYKKIVNIVAGIVVIIFGLSYIGLFRLPFFKGIRKTYKINGVWSAFLFGIVFAVGVGPCTGAFLGSALALASASGTTLKGILLLLFYSLGMGIPFIVTAVLTDKTKKLFGFIKRHFKIVKIVSGGLLIVMGILMATGVTDKLGALFS